MVTMYMMADVAQVFNRGFDKSVPMADVAQTLYTSVVMRVCPCACDGISCCANIPPRAIDSLWQDQRLQCSPHNTQVFQNVALNIQWQENVIQYSTKYNE